MQTFTDEVRSVKARQGKLSAIELAAAPFPMGKSNGTTNAVMFGVALGYLRDENLNMRMPDAAPEFVHHDMDAPPWWNVKKKTYLYIDGFAPKSHRSLMQFLLVPQNDAAKFREWEDDFKDLYAWIEQLEPPKYPLSVDHSLAVARASALRAVVQPLPRHLRRKVDLSRTNWYRSTKSPPIA